jgi:hypothetical protein
MAATWRRVKSRSRASCQFDARSDARPEALVRLRNWLAAIWRFALAMSSSNEPPCTAEISWKIASMSASRLSGSASAETPKIPSRPGPVHE